MAVTYPIILNGVSFYINPNSLDFNQELLYGTLNTENGVTVQTWYNQPGILTVNGVSIGSTAYRELSFLKSEFEQAGKLSEFFYKTHLYYGFIRSLKVGASVEKLFRYPYTLVFQFLKDQDFQVADFSLQNAPWVETLFQLTFEIGGSGETSIEDIFQKLESGLYDASGIKKATETAQVMT